MNKDKRPTKTKNRGVLGLPQEQSKLNMTFSISVPADSPLAETLSRQTAGTRSEWIRSRLNGFDTLLATAKHQSEELLNLERLVTGWKRLAYENAHAAGQHIEPVPKVCWICAETSGVKL